MIDNKFKTNTLQAEELQESKRKEEEEAAMRKFAKKAVKLNNVSSYCWRLIGVCKDYYLKRQFNPRVMRAEKDEFNFASIGDKYRAC